MLDICLAFDWGKIRGSYTKKETVSFLPFTIDSSLSLCYDNGNTFVSAILLYLHFFLSSIGGDKMRQTPKSVSPFSNEARNAYVIEHITDALLTLLKGKGIWSGKIWSGKKTGLCLRGVEPQAQVWTHQQTGRIWKPQFLVLRSNLWTKWPEVVATLPEK